MSRRRTTEYVLRINYSSYLTVLKSETCGHHPSYDMKNIMVAGKKKTPAQKFKSPPRLQRLVGHQNRILRFSKIFISRLSLERRPVKSLFVFLIEGSLASGVL